MTNIVTKLITDAITDNNIKIAAKAIKEQIPIKIIADLTGLDIDTLLELQEQIYECEEKND